MNLRLMALFLALLLLTGGCAGPEVASALQVAQYGTSTFDSGGTETNYPNPFETVAEAARTMVKELDLGLRMDKPYPGFLYLEGKDMHGSTIFIRVRQRTKGITHVRIKVGLLGDAPYSAALMAKLTEILNPSIAKDAGKK